MMNETISICKSGVDMVFLGSDKLKMMLFELIVKTVEAVPERGMSQRFFDSP